MIIIMLGAPGTGKGTTAGVLTKKLGIPQVSTGDIFRENIKKQTELGKKVEEYLAKGALVPDEITIEIVKKRLELPDVESGVILDGFPRTVAQAQKLEEILKNQNRQVDLVVNLDTPEEEIIQRIVNRRVCSNQECKTIYNLIGNPPKEDGICDKCGSKVIQRDDDNEETIRKRMKAYFESTSPLVEFYNKKGIIFNETISNERGKSVDTAVTEIINKLKGE